MKKLLLLLLAVLPLALTSCSDDNDLPDVDFRLQIEGATYVDGAIYVVQGETFEIESITVINREAGKGAAIASATYYWDGYYMGVNLRPNYGFEFETDEYTPLGEHQIQITAPLMAVDKELATAVLVYDVVVVQSQDDIPEGGMTVFSNLPNIEKN